MFWVWCLNFFSGTMFLGFLLTALLLNSPTTIDSEVYNGDNEEWDYMPFWHQYKEEFNKEYATLEEDHRRMEIFIANSKIIDEHNNLHAEGRYSYELGHNQFSDLTHEEYLELYTTNYQAPTNEETNNHPTVKYGDPGITVKAQPTVKYEETIYLQEDVNEYMYIPPEESYLPFNFDWRSHGAVTDVKNEGHCGASWAFSATGALEGQIFKSTHHLISLSEQNLLDCTAKYGNRGCKNGTAANAYRYIQHNHGIDTNQTYPWHGKKSYFCHYKSTPRNPNVRGIVRIATGNETALLKAVANVGPIAVAVDARSNKFKFYKGGIFHDNSCNSRMLNREVLVVGYGHTFFIVKNSWGKKWGANGYMYIMRNGMNQCGIASKALYPLV